MNKLKNIIKLLRPNQWIKNVFVFLPLFLNGDLGCLNELGNACLAFIIFCMVSSSIYCINDAIDAPYDAKNPEKCNRPIANGSISQKEGFAIAAVLLILIIAIILIFRTTSLMNLALPVGIYFVLNFAYSLFLKRLPLIDVIAVSACFLLRVWAGGAACEIIITPWTLIAVFLLTLMLATGKRRQEAWLNEKKGIESRGNIKRYNVNFLSRFIICLGCLSFIFYFLWTLSPYAARKFHSEWLSLTSIWVALGIFRYLSIVVKDNEGGNPTKLFLKDRIILLAVIGWCVSMFAIIY